MNLPQKAKQTRISLWFKTETEQFTCQKHNQRLLDDFNVKGLLSLNIILCIKCMVYEYYVRQTTKFNLDSRLKCRYMVCPAPISNQSLQCQMYFKIQSSKVQWKLTQWYTKHFVFRRFRCVEIDFAKFLFLSSLFLA